MCEPVTMAARKRLNVAPALPCLRGTFDTKTRGRSIAFFKRGKRWRLRPRGRAISWFWKPTPSQRRNGGASGGLLRRFNVGTQKPDGGNSSITSRQKQGAAGITTAAPYVAG
jgi:hypothetical protein